MASVFNALRQKLDASGDLSEVDTDDYDHPYITSIFAYVAKYHTPTDDHDALEKFSKVAKQVEAKDGKINMAGWDCIHYGKDKNGRIISGGKEWTLKKICDTVNNHKTLREYVIKESFFASCFSGKQQICAPKPEDLPSLMYSECANSYDLSGEMISIGRFDPKVKINHFNETNTMRVCDTSKELRIKKDIWIQEAKKYLNFIGVDFDEDAFNKAIDEQFFDNFTQSTCADKKVWVYNDTIHKVSRIRDLIEEAAGRGLIKGYIGSPGTGKTYSTIQDIAASKKAFGFALSNTVAFNMKKRGGNYNLDVEPYSFSRVMYSAAVDRNKFIKSLEHPIMIDETSQMGLKDLPILKVALEASLSHDTKLELMGDLNQIPSFLSRGSVLYSMVETFPDIFTELTVNHRVDETSRDMVDAVNSFAESHDTSVFQKYNTDRPTIDSIISDCDNDTVFICGSTYQASCTSQDVLRHKIDGFVPCFSNDNWFNILYRTNKDLVNEYLGSNDLKFRAKATANYTDLCTKKKFKIRTNEEYLVTMFDSTSVRIESLLTKEYHVIHYSALCIDFEPAYAITANRAQGLEWDTVVIMYGDYYAKTTEATAFKGNYPIRNKFEHLYVSCSRARKQMFMYYGNFKDSTLVPLTKYNIFDIIDA